MPSPSLSRRGFLGLGAAAAAGAASNALRPPRQFITDLNYGSTDAKTRTAQLNEVTTIRVIGEIDRGRNFVEFADTAEVDFVVTQPDGGQFKLPAFNIGNHWFCHFAGSQLGPYTLESKCSTPEDIGLHGQKFSVTVTPYTGDNALRRAGRLRVAADKSHLVHVNGDPFLWIGDTWWMGLCGRLNNDGFNMLLNDRLEKDFSLIQIIAGPYPDMDAWDPRGRSDNRHYPFEEGFARADAEYHGLAEHRIRAIVEAGLVPCIVGMWGYYLPQIGIDKVKRYWRHLVARYAALPVVWCICGEATMPYYLSEKKDEDAAAQKAGWTEVMRYVREIDGYHNPITIHPTQYGHEQVNDPSLMDVDMLQTGHSDIETIPNVIKSVRAAVAHEPKMPVVNGEVNYEGIMGRCWQNIIRLSFYHSMLNGASGFTYGANGIWQVNEQGKPYGPSPHGRAWGNTPWEEAMNLPGSRQVGLGGKFFARFPWWELQRQPDWYDESKKENDAYGVVVAGIPRKLRIAYAPMCWNPPTIKAIETDLQYSAYYFDPITGSEIALGPIKPDENGNWTPPFPPEVHDWVIVLQA